jgi:glycerol-3-phosphate O-acyltransferase
LSLVAAAESGAGGDPIGASLAEALRLRDLLKFEFFFAEKPEYEAELRAEAAIIEPSWREEGGTALHTLAERLAVSGGLMADRVLRSFLEAYYVVADRLLARGGAAVDEKHLVRDCLVVGRQYQLQRRIVSGEAVSAELFRTGIRLARNRELLSGDAAALLAGRDTLAGQLHDALRRLEILGRWERAHHLRREGDLVAVKPADPEAQA